MPGPQGEAIAYNLREMFGLRVPIISLVIGEGGSGGALAIGCANRNLIMENAVYYVASPEACAAILWKSRAAAAQVSSRRCSGAWAIHMEEGGRRCQVQAVPRGQGSAGVPTTHRLTCAPPALPTSLPCPARPLRRCASLRPSWSSLA